MMTRELYAYDPWLGLYPDAVPRSDMSRGAGAQVTPAAMVERPVGLGMDPTDPSTHSRPYNPSPGMFGRLASDQALAARRQAGR